MYYLNSVAFHSGKKIDDDFMWYSKKNWLGKMNVFLMERWKVAQRFLGLVRVLQLVGWIQETHFFFGLVLDWYSNLTCLCFVGVAVGQYLQNVTKNLSLGAEVLYQYGPQVPGNQIAIYTLAGRYASQYTYLFFVFVFWGGGVNDQERELKKHFDTFLCVH